MIILWLQSLLSIKSLDISSLTLNSLVTEPVDYKSTHRPMIDNGDESLRHNSILQFLKNLKQVIKLLLEDVAEGSK